MNRRNFIKLSISLPFLISSDIESIQTDNLIEYEQADELTDFMNAIYHEVAKAAQVPERILRLSSTEKYSSAKLDILSRKTIFY